MQDSAVDKAIFFRADTGANFHCDFRDPAGIFEPDGGENARTGAFRLVGRKLAATERLAATGVDVNGFALRTGRTATHDVIRILVANYAIPVDYLVARDRDVFEFQVPIGALRTDMSLIEPPRRVNAASAGHTGYTLDVANLPWGEGPHRIVRYRADAGHPGEMLDAMKRRRSSRHPSGGLGRNGCGDDRNQPSLICDRDG